MSFFSAMGVAVVRECEEDGTRGGVEDVDGRGSPLSSCSRDKVGHTPR